MLVYLLYMLVFLAKEEQIVSQQVRPGDRRKTVLRHGKALSSFYINVFFFQSTSRIPLSLAC